MVDVPLQSGSLDSKAKQKNRAINKIRLLKQSVDPATRGSGEPGSFSGCSTAVKLTKSLAERVSLGKPLNLEVSHE